MKWKQRKERKEGRKEVRMETRNREEGGRKGQTKKDDKWRRVGGEMLQMNEGRRHKRRARKKDRTPEGKG